GAAGAIFNAFFSHWCRVVTTERLSDEAAELATANAGGLATALLTGNDVGWFNRRDRRRAVQGALLAALDDLTTRLGPDPTAWKWGRLHTLVQKHFLSGVGDPC